MVGELQNNTCRRFTEKVVLITGGAAGLGAATARRVASEGGHPILLDVQEDKLKRVALEVKGSAVVGSALDQDVLERAVAIADDLGGLDALVAAAGFETYGGVEEVDFEQWKRVLDINLDAALMASRACIPSMRKKGRGSIVLISSIGGMLGSKFNVAYGTAKAGLLGMNRSLAIDCAAQNIRCNAVCPGMARSELSDRLFNNLAELFGVATDQIEADLVKANPLGRIGEAEEVASAIAFLASDDASYVNGSALTVDGGASAVEAMLSHVAPQSFG